MNKSSLHFLLMFLGLTLLLGGALLWIAVLDYDYHYSMEGSYDSYPDHLDEQGGFAPFSSSGNEFEYFKNLPPEKQQTVTEAIDGRDYSFASPTPVPPAIVKKDETFYAFNTQRSFDWTDPGMAGATGLSILGLFVMFDAVRREQFPHVTYSDWLN